MPLSLRWRILLAVAPLVLILVALGVVAALFLYDLGGRIDLILRENYRSVLYMERMHEALREIDSSFHIAFAGRAQQAQRQFEDAWKRFDENLRQEQENITLPGEKELVAQLTRLADRYRRQGTKFFEHAPDSAERRQAYFALEGDNGVLPQLQDEIKEVSGKILHINQENMEHASADARATARSSLLRFGVSLALGVFLAGFFAWRTIKTVLRPIEQVTQSAREIVAGNLDQVMAVESNDELGQLAGTFNLLARHLRDYRESQSAQLLRAQQTMQAAIDSFPDAVLVIDAAGKVEMANPAARRLLGVAPQHASRDAWQPPEALREPLAIALRGEGDYLPESFDKVVELGKESAERVLLPRVLTIRDPYGASLGAAVLLQDVTRLRLLDQVKSNLVATASHELKTPLTSIRLAIHLLIEEAAGPLAPKQSELLLDARENCERLLAMVNNLLDLARLEQGWRQLDLQPTAPETLLRSAADSVRARAEDKGVAIVIDAPADLPLVAVDGTRLDTALRNLLDNALTYTDAGKHITLSAVRDGGFVTLAVADNGIGIPPEHLPHVFEKFFRVPGQSRASGTGLGLAIVHEIVAAHSGTITCESGVDRGTIFRLRLPIAVQTP